METYYFTIEFADQEMPICVTKLTYSPVLREFQPVVYNLEDFRRSVLKYRGLWKSSLLSEVDKDLDEFFKSLHPIFRKHLFKVYYRGKVSGEHLWKILLQSLYISIETRILAKSVLLGERGYYFVTDLYFKSIDRTTGEVGRENIVSAIAMGRREDIEQILKLLSIAENLVKIVGSDGKLETITDKEEVVDNFVVAKKEYAIKDRQAAIKAAKMISLIKIATEGEFLSERVIELLLALSVDSSVLNYVDIIAKLAENDFRGADIWEIIDVLRVTPPNKRVKVFLALLAVM